MCNCSCETETTLVAVLNDSLISEEQFDTVKKTLEETLGREIAFVVGDIRFYEVKKTD